MEDDKDQPAAISLSRAEMDQIIAAADADGLRTAAIIRLFLTNGYTVSGIIGAQITDLGSEHGHRAISTTVRGGRRVRDPLPAPTALAIDAYLESRGSPQEGPLFVTSSGKPLDRFYLRKLVARLCREAGVPEVSPHGLRHSAIAELLEITNGNIALAQDFAHHAVPQSTQKYDRRRHQLDGHGAYILAGRYGVRHEEAGDAPPAP